MKLALRMICFFLLVFAVAPTLPAQDGTQSLGDLARQERERKRMKASEIPELKEASFKANILITDSHAAIEKWVFMSPADRPNAGRLRELVLDKMFYFPFVVTDYPWPATERMKLTAHVRVITPDGKIMYEAPEISGAIGSDPRVPSVIVLNPVMNITFDKTDLPGTYTVSATITDHVHSVYAKAEEQFQLTVANGTKREAAKTVVSGTKP
jgi:hypothetical protein